MALKMEIEKTPGNLLLGVFLIEYEMVAVCLSISDFSLYGGICI